MTGRIPANPSLTSRLRRARRARGWTQLQVVRKIAAAAGDQGMAVAEPASLEVMYARWETGRRNVSDHYRHLLGTVFDCEPEALGFAGHLSRPSPTRPAARVVDAVTGTPSTSALQVTYQVSLADSVTSLALLAGSDPNGESFSPESTSNIALDWLFGESGDDPSADCRVVTATHIQEIRQATRLFDEIDRTVRSGGALGIAVRYLSQRVLPHLRSSARATEPRDLFRASAALCELIAWMFYDHCQHGFAQRYFAHALRLAAAANDRCYGAYVLSSMSDQALFAATR